MFIYHNYNLSVTGYGGWDGADVYKLIAPYPLLLPLGIGDVEGHQPLVWSLDTWCCYHILVMGK